MLCNQCGYRNEDTANACRSCGASLGDAPSKEEVAKTIDKLNRRYNEDPLVPTKFAKGFMWTCFASAVTFVFWGTLVLDKIGFGIVAAFFSLSAGLVARFPSFSWFFTKHKIEQISNASNPKPSDLWMFNHKLGYWLLFAFAIIILLFGLHATITNAINIPINTLPGTDFFSNPPSSIFIPSPEVPIVS